MSTYRSFEISTATPQSQIYFNSNGSSFEPIRRIGLILFSFSENFIL